MDTSVPDAHYSTGTTIIVIDDHEILTTALVVMLRREGFDAHPVPVSDPAAMLARAREYRPGVALVDLDLGDSGGSHLDGSDLVSPLCRQGWRVLVVTGMTDLDRVAAAVYHGATSWVTKSARFEELTQYVAEVARGGGSMPEEERAALLRRFQEYAPARTAALRRLARLTAREREVLDRLADGATPADVAAVTHTSLGTVRTHIRAILAKLEVNSQIAAVALAHRYRGQSAPISTTWWRTVTRFTRRW